MNNYNPLNNNKSDIERKAKSDVNDFISITKQAHVQGHLALHIVLDTSIIYDKLDDRRILNNLREDGGTDKRRDCYQLHTVISGTVMPAEKYPIEQRIHQTMGREYFVGIDL